jgi:hypothetical protein
LAIGDFALDTAPAAATAAAAATTGTAAIPASDPIVAAVLDTGLSGCRDSTSAIGAGVSSACCHEKNKFFKIKLGNRFCQTNDYLCGVYKRNFKRCYWFQNWFLCLLKVKNKVK